MAKYCVPDERDAVNHSTSWCALVVICTFAAGAQANSERLLATGGVTQVEGSGGGGLNPWALISGLETNSEVGGSADCTYVRPQHFSLMSCGVAVGIHDRIELSYARQTFDLDDVAPGRSIRQDTAGAKLRVYGDAVYDQDRLWPQLALGLQYKHNRDYDFIPQLIGARRGDGIDFYLALTKVFLAGPFGRTWLIDGNVRATRANQFGILGFGGDRNNDYSFVGEASVATFITDSLIVGAEYRQKPDKISAFREQDARDVFVAWFPVKYLSLTAAYVDVGNIATHAGQKGWYVALQGSL
ncbi:MAG: DUF3034 family protein [Proteobacteria bacterium]|nr:DUF3034 family protein [Pseudomonadota bacterium]